jgi:GNAT superfamily N-acetyltransferase
MRILRLKGKRLSRYLPEALALHRKVLGPLSQRRLRSVLRGRRKLLLVALVQGRVVGYKFGYEERPGRFYSWIGGVDPDFRRRGIARALMARQHRLLERAGFRTVRSQTRNRYPGMLILSILSGFEIIGTLAGPETRIVLEKKLGRSPALDGQS